MGRNNIKFKLDRGFANDKLLHIIHDLTFKHYIRTVKQQRVKSANFEVWRKLQRCYPVRTVGHRDLRMI